MRLNMAECIYFSGANNNCSKYSANKISKNRVLFLMFLFCVFFFGNAKVFSQVQPPGTGAWNAPYQISTMQHWIWFANNGSNQPAPNNNFELAGDIGSLANPVTQMVSGVFMGYLNGNDYRITVNLDYTNSNEPNVGLFSKLSFGSLIRELIIDGYVIGGVNSVNVGGLVGLVTSGSVYFVTNLADVTGLAFNSSVGGIAGKIASNDWIGFSALVNNGSIIGGQYVAGIVGFAYYTGREDRITIRCSQNAGKIKSNNANNVEFPTYMAGIVAYVFGTSVNLHDLVNIGQVLSSNANFAGGIIAYLESWGGNNAIHTDCIYSFSNSGIVDGAKNFVGGVFGYINVSNGTVYGCINTNWVEPTSNGLNSGAIAGFNAGALIIACFYDEQMCVLNNGIGVGLSTTQMLGNSLQPLLSLGLGFWIYRNNLYPSPIDAWPGNINHPIALLSAAPIYLENNPATGIVERLDEVSTSPFQVSNNYWFPNYNPALHPYLFPYRWEGINGYINIPTTFDDAFIIGTGGILRQDSLRVRLINEPLYEKVVPIWVR